MTTKPVQVGDKYTTRLGHIVRAAESGLLVLELGEVIPDARMASVLNENGGYRVKPRKGKPGQPEQGETQL